MMISPEAYYSEYLEGKTAEEIKRVIRGLKQTIGRLKNTMESPSYQCTSYPSEEVRLWCTRMYLERAKQALREAGGSYVCSKAELRAEAFQASIPFIGKLELCIGGFFHGFEIRACTVEDDRIFMETSHVSMLQPPSEQEAEVTELEKESFLESLAELYVGEWRRSYNPSRWGYAVLDGTQWYLHVYYTDGRKPVKIEGSNDYPYNFDKLQELFDIDPWTEDPTDEQE